MDEKKVSSLTDHTGKPSDTRRKSWVCFIVALGVMIVDLMGKGTEESMTYFIILFAGGVSWQLVAKGMETFMSKKL